MAFVVLLCVFCIRFAGENWPAYRRFAMIFAIVVAPLLYVASAAGALGPATVYVRLVGIALVAVALAAVARYALRLRNTESLLLAATGLIAIVFAIHDWMADQDPLAIRPLWLVPYSAFAFLVLFSWILIDRFVRALDEYERLNADLEQRIAAKSASLEFQLMQTEQARQEAESANRAKSRFLAAASHDLRQPLHALGLFADALPGHTRDDEGRELVHRIGTSVASLDALLSALLDISKLDAGVIAVERKDMRELGVARVKVRFATVGGAERHAEVGEVLDLAAHHLEEDARVSGCVSRGVRERDHAVSRIREVRIRHRNYDVSSHGGVRNGELIRVGDE